MLEQPGIFHCHISRWVKCEKDDGRYCVCKSMDADANGTVAAVTDDGKLYFIRQERSRMLWSHPRELIFPAVSLMKTGFCMPELHRMRYFAMAVIRESGNTGKRKAVKNYPI